MLGDLKFGKINQWVNSKDGTLLTNRETKETLTKQLWEKRFKDVKKVKNKKIVCK
jgi:hypothetical protein